MSEMSEQYVQKLIGNKEAARKRIEASKLLLLESPTLFEKITIDEYDKKIVGEVKSRQTLFLCAIGGLFVKNSSPAAYNLMVNSKSGAGKDFVTKRVLQILPKDKVEKRTRISPAAFTYWHNSKHEPNWTWEGKVCYLSDISNTILNHEVFKVMCTEGSHATIVKDQKAVDIEIKGKPALFITTAGAMPNDEMLRRFPILELDETQEQTEAIMQREAEFAALGLTNEYDAKITHALAELQRLDVRIPFAPQIVSLFSSGHVIMRTHFNRMLDYIKASAVLYQFQREREGVYVIATPEDYDRARIAMVKTTSNPLMIPLTRNDRRVLDVARMQLNSLEREGWFSVADILHKVTFMSERSLYVHLSKLSENGFLLVRRYDRDNSFRPVTEYKFVELSVSIPTWEEICRISANTSTPSITTINSNTSITQEKASNTQIRKKRHSQVAGVIEAFEAFEATNEPTDLQEQHDSKNKTLDGETLVLLRFMKNCGPYLRGGTGESIGPFKENQEAHVPELMAGVLVRKGFAQEQQKGR